MSLEVFSELPDFPLIKDCLYCGLGVVWAERGEFVHVLTSRTNCVQAVATMEYWLEPPHEGFS